VIDLPLPGSDRPGHVQINVDPSGTSHRGTSRKDTFDIITTPLNYWLWHGLCRMHAKQHDIAGAIKACESGIKRSTTNPSPLMELSNLYAVNGDYNAAVLTGQQAFRIKPSWHRLALLDPKEPWTTPNPYEHEMKRSLKKCRNTRFRYRRNRKLSSGMTWRSRNDDIEHSRCSQ